MDALNEEWGSPNVVGIGGAGDDGTDQRGMDIVLERYGLTTRQLERERWREEERKRQEKELVEQNEFPGGKEDEAVYATFVLENAVRDDDELLRRVVMMPQNSLKSSLLLLQSDPRLVTMDLSGEQFTRNGSMEQIALLAYVLGKNECITTLILSGCDVNKDALSAIVGSLVKNAENSKVATLDISENWIADDGGPVFAELLRNTTSLTHLNLSHNKLGGWRDKAGLSKMANALKDNKTLAHLQLNSCHLNANDIACFQQCFAANSSLRSMNIEGNNLEEEGKKVMANALMSSDSCRIDTFTCDEWAINKTQVSVAPPPILCLYDSHTRVHCRRHSISPSTMGKMRIVG
jgi:hypothetical protein